ncbi:MAG TPA: HEAT repeat domain-containing protein [Desulfuromonadaceae bacterium]
MKSLPNIQKLLRSLHEETRHGAIQALRDRLLPEICDLLFFAMADESWRVRKEAVDVFVAANPDEAAIDGLLELLRNEDNAGLRNSAAEAVSRIGTRAAKSLQALAQDKDEDVRKFIIDVMGIIGSPDFVPTLLVSLGDPDVNVASAAAEHLGNIGDERAVPDLIKAIVDNDAVFFRFSALTALSKFTSHLPVPSEIIRLAEQNILQKSVYDCLGSIGDDAVIPILLEGFRSRKKSCRNSAIKSWYRIFSRSRGTVRLKLQEDLQSHSGSDLVPILIDSFDLQDIALSEAITTLLGIIGDIRGAEALLKAFSCERISGSALASLKCLGSHGVNHLISLYPSCEESGRCAICTVVGQIGYRDGDVVRKGLDDSSDQVKLCALKAAGKLGLTDCIPGVVKLLEENDAELRAAVISCLCSLACFHRGAIQEVARRLEGSDQSEQRLEAVILNAALGDNERLELLLKDENAFVRQAAVTAIGKQRIASGSSVLLMALVDEDVEVRIAAAEAIGKVGDAEAIPYLVLALNDDDCWVQCEALKSIARIDKERIFPSIQPIFVNAKGFLLKTCLELLEAVGSRASFEQVETVLDKADGEAFSLAMSILVRQGGEWVLSNVDRLMSHPRTEVRTAWAGVLAELPPQQAKRHLIHAMKHEKDINIKTLIQDLLKGIA